MIVCHIFKRVLVALLLIGVFGCRLMFRRFNWLVCSLFLVLLNVLCLFFILNMEVVLLLIISYGILFVISMLHRLTVWLMRHSLLFLTLYHPIVDLNVWGVWLRQRIRSSCHRLWTSLFLSIRIDLPRNIGGHLLPRYKANRNFEYVYLSNNTYLLFAICAQSEFIESPWID